MKTKFSQTERRDVTIDFAKTQGPLNYRNHTFGIGGINALPMPEGVSNGVRNLKPRFIRIFLQEFFFIYPETGVFDWSRMDAYVKSVYEMGGVDIMAHITIKPNVLYPIIDENIWQPTSVEEWQDIITAMVQRYSVENQYITHWAVGNEINIGELGGCPYKFDSPKDYFEYYKMTVAAITRANPSVKIGGPAWAFVHDDAESFYTKFFDLVKQENIRLDFISYNAYTDHPHEHLYAANIFRKFGDAYSKDLEIYVTELNVSLVPDVEETAYMGARSASLAASIMSLTDANLLDGTFHYHIMDQACYIDDFKPFYSKCRYMSDHWNDYPHRLGLMDWDGNPRPQYFMYQLLYKMSGERIAASTNDSGNLYLAATKTTDSSTNILIANFNPDEPTDLTAKVQLLGNPEGRYNLKTYRVDDTRYNTIDMPPIENRDVYMGADFKFPIYAPAYSVVLVQLTKK